MADGIKTDIYYQSGPRDKYHCGLEYPPGFLSQAVSIRKRKYPRLIFAPKPDVTTQGEIGRAHV